MKYLYGSLMVLTILSITLLTGCKKDEGNPAAGPSYVDSYTVTLTEPEGTTYSGDFFPIVAGYTCSFEGTANIQSTSSSPFGASDTTFSGPAYGSLQVLHRRAVTLPSGTMQLYPVVDETDAPGQYLADTTRFFESDTDAVYIRAIKLSNGSYLEVANPMFIKRTLTVGDSWESSPAIDMSQVFADQMSGGTQANFKDSIRAKFFVAGKESISLPLPFGMRTAVRVEQANDVSLNGTITESQYSMGIAVTSQTATVYHLIADTGIVEQNTTGVMNLNMTTPLGPVTVSVKINECDLKIISLSGAPRVIAKRNVTFDQPTLADARLDARVKKVSQVITDIVLRKLTIK